MDTALIRRSTEQDIETLMQLYGEFHEFHVRGVPNRLCSTDVSDNTEDTEFPKILSDLLHHEDVAIIVAEVGSMPVGLAEVYLL